MMTCNKMETGTEIRAALLYCATHRNNLQLMMISEHETAKFNAVIIILISCLCVLCSLRVLTSRRNGSTFVCSFGQAPSLYCISAPGGTLLGLSGEGHLCPTAFLCCPQETRRVSIPMLWKCKSDWVAGHHPWLSSDSYAPWQPMSYLASPFLTREWITRAVVPTCLLWNWCTAQLLLASGRQCTLKKRNSHFSLNVSNIITHCCK